MKKYLKLRALISFKDQILPVEEIGGIMDDIIVFNPDRTKGGENYKIQLTDKLFVRSENSTELISYCDIENDFVILNSMDEEIANSNDLHPEFVDALFERMFSAKIMDLKFN